MDQVIVSLGNFLTLGIAARGMGSLEFGRFAVALTTALAIISMTARVVGQFHNVMAQRGPDQHASSVTTTVVRAQVGTSALTAAAVFMAGLVLVCIGAGPAITFWLASVPALVGWQFYELARRLCYSGDRTVLAAAMSLLSYGMQVGLLVYLWRRSALSELTAIGVIGASSLLAAGAGANALGLWKHIGWAMRESLYRVWSFGGWLVMEQVSYWLTLPLMTYVLAVAHSPVEAGGLKAAQSLLGPLNVPLLFAATVLPVRFSRQQFQASEGRSLRRGQASFALEIGAPTAVIVLTVLAYGAAIGVVAGPSLGFVFGQEFKQYANITRILVAYYLASGVGQVLFSALKGMGDPRGVFLANMTSGVVAASVGVGLTLRHGAAGSAFALIGATAVGTCVAAWRVGSHQVSSSGDERRNMSSESPR